MYACHHAPAIAVQNPKAVILCNSIGHEYERCHRTLRQLAARLAAKGDHAMRFDYLMNELKELPNITVSPRRAIP